ncbi:uncharacterized protein Z518_02904 [Rhinocladiella mackenziei CBS 650.93]|uniref:Large ribosomal subunit protein mL67 n=1 Tax=Rhinocladiella mackenziei CBS 650.93 TaxID=1442369 RepID=A0A0D2HCQ0_9EURO|nr:uncharacterized protein Z518_02904 [Rhinocladiella mackenziei CBS 650.93]KIX08248.1 hypothetical protein Z518_02904 [Rhinocladiella mackenziei CBS 650.93]
MAAAATNSMAHHMPRVRPPRLMKGDPHPNAKPQPPGEAPHDALWVQGRWRNPRSSAVKHERATQTRQVLKALRCETRGLNIYAYRHIRTNQVVYSLTRTLESTKILKQLVFHGKKTVPATVRRDMWTPYYSIQFPPTPAGALQGLFAFQKLRELSRQRQLSPPEALIKVTQEDIDVVASKLGSPVDLQEMEVRDLLIGKKKIPKLDEILPKKLRGRRLMDHKAFSVADAAFVLGWISSGPRPLEKLTEVETNRVVRHQNRTKRARKRINAIRVEEEKKKQEIRKRASWVLDEPDPNDRTRLPLSRRALQELSMDVHGSVDGHRLVDVEHIQDIRKAIKDWESFSQIDSTTVDKNMWTDRQSAARKAEWRAIREWFETNDVPVTESDSVWQKVAEARTAALKAFDDQTKSEAEKTKLERRERILKTAAKEARIRYESKARVSDPESPEQSLEEFIEKEKKIALEKFEEDEAGKKEPEWADSREIKMFWADMNDGLFAGAWPQNVVHSHLAPFGISRAVERVTAEHAVEDLPEKKEKADDGVRTRETNIVKAKSVHVIGGAMDDGWMPFEMATKSNQEPPVWTPRPGEEDEDEESEPYRGPETRSEKETEKKEFEDKELDSFVVEAKPAGVFGRLRSFFSH